MAEPVLTFFKYLFLAVLYLFFLRVLRAVWTELREPKAATGEAAPLADAAAAAPTTSVPARAPTPAGGVGTLARVVVRNASGALGPAFELRGETTVGRSPGCGVALPADSFVSQIHARLYERDGATWVEDLGSTNGTFVNDRRLDGAAPLRPGDRLRVGTTDLELET